MASILLVLTGEPVIDPPQAQVVTHRKYGGAKLCQVMGAANTRNCTGAFPDRHEPVFVKLPYLLGTGLFRRFEEIENGSQQESLYRYFGRCNTCGASV